MVLKEVNSNTNLNSMVNTEEKKQWQNYWYFINFCHFQQAEEKIDLFCI